MMEGAKELLAPYDTGLLHTTTKETGKAMLIFYLALLENGGERDKFTVIYQNHRKSMYYAANGILQSNALAEDAVHDAFMRILPHLHKLDPNDFYRTRGYLVTTVRNVAYSMLQKRKKELPAYEALHGTPSCKPQETQDQAQTDIEHLAALIKELSPEHREILSLVYFHGLKIPQAARTLGIKAPAARKRLQRAREELKKRMEQGGLDPP